MFKCSLHGTLVYTENGKAPNRCSWYGKWSGRGKLPVLEQVVMPTLKDNKQSRFDYEILEEYEAGIVLTGPEVKSAKRGQISLQGSYVSLRNEQLWLVHCHISPYQLATTIGTYEPERERRLLLRKEEIRSLIGKLQSRGLTLIPLSFYTKAGLIKVRLGLGRGRKKFDKRAQIKKRETDRKIQKALRARS